MGIEQDLLQLLCEHNVVSQYILRDNQIKKDFQNLRKSGVTAKKTIELLADKYITGESNIKRIIYGRQKLFMINKILTEELNKKHK